MKIIFVGLLPPDSHNPEERRFVEEVRRIVDEVRYVRGIGIKGFGSRQLKSLLRRSSASNTSAPVGRLLVAPPRQLLHLLNVRWLRRQLLTLAEGRPEDWVIWTRFPSPELVEVIEGMRFCSTIYEPIDRYDASLDFTRAERRRVAAAEARLIGRAAVIAGGAGIARRLGQATGGSIWLPFGRDSRAQAAVHAPISRGHPRIGTVAEFDWRVDEQSIAALARKRRDWRIVLVGPRRKNWGRNLRQLPNVDLVGRVEPENVPAAIRTFDAALIPYITNDWTRACLPVKLYEYLAEGLPVVSTDLPELAPFSDVVDRVPPESFADAIARALATDTLEARQRRARASTRFTLQERARLAVSRLQEKPRATVAR